MVQGGGNTPNVASGAVTIGTTEAQVYTVLGQWLLTVLPVGCRVLRGQLNQTAAPIGLFATMTIIRRERIATNDWFYTQTQRVVTEPTKLAVQVGIFGPGSGDAIQTVIALWRDMNAADWFATSGVPMAPLYASEAREMGFISAEKQYTEQWSADLHAQVNFALTLPQAFATSGTVSTIEADAQPQGGAA